VREPLITLTCDCGSTVEIGYGAVWTCDACGKTWDTNRIPASEYGALVAAVRRYRLLVLGPPVVMAAVLIPLAVLSGLQFAFLLFVLVMGYGLLAVPQLRRRSAAQMQKSTKSWKLRSE